jgi:hypothetical protein
MNPQDCTGIARLCKERLSVNESIEIHLLIESSGFFVGF